MNEIKQPQQEVWDFKKIAIFLLILAVLGGALFFGFRNQRVLSEGEVRGTTEATEQKEVPKIEFPTLTNFQDTFDEKFNEIREDAENIDVVEVASSSPQIQKFLNDFKNLQNYPRNQAKEACFNACSNICGGL